MTDMKQLGRQVSIMLLILLASWLSALVISDLLITLVYEDKLFSALGKLMVNRDVNSAAHYVQKLRSPITAAHLIIGLLIIIAMTVKFKSAMTVLGLFIAGDILLLVFSLRTSTPILNLAVDWSIPEIFQYVKEIWVASMMFYLFRTTKNGVYFAIMILSIFMFLDDAFKYHEQIGHFLAPALAATSLPSTLKIAPNFIGEVLSLLPLLLVAPVGLYWFLKATRHVQVFALIWGVLLSLLVLFGVVFDFFAHSGMAPSLAARQVMTDLEDIGEMIVMTAIVAHVFRHFWSNRRDS